MNKLAIALCLGLAMAAQAPVRATAADMSATGSPAAPATHPIAPAHKPPLKCPPDQPAQYECLKYAPPTPGSGQLFGPCLKMGWKCSIKPGTIQ